MEYQEIDTTIYHLTCRKKRIDDLREPSMSFNPLGWLFPQSLTFAGLRHASKNEDTLNTHLYSPKQNLKIINKHDVRKPNIKMFHPALFHCYTIDYHRLPEHPTSSTIHIFHATVNWNSQEPHLNRAPSCLHPWKGECATTWSIFKGKCMRSSFLRTKNWSVLKTQTPSKLEAARRNVPLFCIFLHGLPT